MMFRLDSDKNKDICINRTKGEDFSLMVEIVRSKRVVRLFEDLTQINLTKTTSISAIIHDSQRETLLQRPQDRLYPPHRLSAPKFSGKMPLGQMELNSSK